MESQLPAGFEVALEELCPNQAQPAGHKKGPSGRSKPKAEPKPAKAPTKRPVEPTKCVPPSVADRSQHDRAGQSRRDTLDC